MNSTTARSSSHSLNKRERNDADPHSHDEDDKNEIAKKAKLSNGGDDYDEKLVSIQVGGPPAAAGDQWKKFSKLLCAFTSTKQYAVDMNKKPIFVKEKKIEVKGIVTTSTLLTQSGVVVVAGGGAHATSYLARKAIDGMLQTSTGGLLALPVISDIVSVLLVDNKGSLIQRHDGATKPIEFLINLTIGDQYKEYYSSIFQVDKNTYCDDDLGPQIIGAINLSLQDMDMINFLSPSVQLIGKVVGKMFKDFFATLLKKLQGLDMMKKFPTQVLECLYEMLGKFFKGRFRHIRNAFSAFEESLHPDALEYYTPSTKKSFRFMVTEAVKTFEAVKKKRDTILQKLTDLVEEAFEKVRELQTKHELISEETDAPNEYVQTTTKVSDDYVEEAVQEVEETSFSVDVMDRQLANKLLEKERKEKEGDGGVSNPPQGDLILKRSVMFSYLAKWVFGDVEIKWIEPSNKILTRTPQEKHHMAIKNNFMFQQSGVVRELRDKLKKKDTKKK